MSVPFTHYPSIEQFRNVVKEVNYHFGTSSTPAPSITFTGTVKLHGTNAGVGWDFDGELLCQSRNHHISVGDDNAGFAKFVSSPNVTREIKRIMQQLKGTRDCMSSIILYGEWCGKDIQRGVAITELPPMFVLFGGIYRTSGDDTPLWFTEDSIQSLRPAAETRVFNIYQFPTWTRNIVFKQPELGLMQNELAQLTNAVEQECPVAHYFGISGIGEGIVWTGRIIVREMVKFTICVSKSKGKSIPCLKLRH